MIIFFCLIYIFYKDSVVRSNGAWKVNETEVSIFSKRKTLQIHKATQANMGKYICRASNSIGAVDAQVQLYRKLLFTFIQ